jgi:D-alanyl-D-alanine carboxypeptidase
VDPLSSPHVWKLTTIAAAYGHTGSFPGYAQWAAATADGKRSVTTTLNIPPPKDALLDQLRSVQASAVCALLSAEAASS